LNASTRQIALTPSSSARASEAGFVLILTLLILSALTLLTIALFTLTQNDTLQARNYSDRERAQLAATSAFETAKALLLEQTAGDDYLVVAAPDTDPSPAPITPYHFLSRLTEDGQLVHVPLYAGGIVQTTPFGEPPTWGRIAALPPADAAIIGLQEVGGERFLNETEDTEQRINVRIPLVPVYTSWIDGRLLTGDQRMRFTYWIEDLESRPQADVVGSVRAAFGEGGTGTAETFRLGYSSLDSRTLGGFSSTPRFGGAGGTRFPLASDAANLLGEPAVPQDLYDAIAPGLSPKEVNLGARLPNGAAAPLVRTAARTGSLLTPGGGYATGGQVSGEFSVGLRPYLRQPFIPSGHNYPNAGSPKANLNALIAEGPEAVADYLRANLPPGWEQRGGAFPDDYLATLAANIVDYADEDHEPSGSGEDRVRGVDTYPVVNEIYLHIEWEEALVDDETAPSKIDLELLVTPYVEFWNPTNREFPEERLDFVYSAPDDVTGDMEVIATRYVAEFGAEKHLISLVDVENIIEVDGTAVPAGAAAAARILLGADVGLLPNEYKTVVFPTVKYAFDELEVRDGEGRPLELVFRGDDSHPAVGANEPNVAGQPTADLASTYIIEWNETVIDAAPGFLTRQELSLNWGDPRQQIGPVRSGLVGGQAGWSYAKNSGSGVPIPQGEPIFNPGDPRMSYHIVHHAQRGTRYRSDATFGSRNARRSVPSGRVAREVDPEIWPDGGYQTETLDPPGTPDVPPATGNPLEDKYTEEPTGESSYLARAPYRLSNLGRYFSVSELGNIYDPLMYPSNQDLSDQEQWRAIGEAAIAGEPGAGNAASAQGGGNTLRIGRPEHPRLIADGVPASQLLDLFHVGVNGTNLELLEDVPYEPDTNVLPPSARDAESTGDHPHSALFGGLHAESPVELVRGRLNINTASPGDIRTLLEGVFAMDEGYGDEVGQDERHAYQSLAREIVDNRPYASLSQLADVFTEFPAVFREDQAQSPTSREDEISRYAASDAVQEETFARCMNLGSLTSRHFRIMVVGQYMPPKYLERPNSKPVSTVSRVYEVFLRPIHDIETGELIEVRCEVLSERDR